MAFDLFHGRKLTISGTQAQMLEQARLRLVWVVMVMMMGYIAIILRMGDLCLLHHKSMSLPANNGAVAANEKPLRASIVDRNGNLLAVSLRMASVYANAKMVHDPAKLAQKLAAILPKQTTGELFKRLSSGKGFVWIQRFITPKQEYAINALGDPAIRFQEEQRRIYPDANLAAQVVGYTDIDSHGIAGIEKFFNKRLAAGGKPLRLTLDMRIQHIMRQDLAKSVKTFHALGGAGIVMDVTTGEIIAMVSLPDFDPNHLGEATNAEKFDRATLGDYEMGSTFKTFSIAAGLDSGKVHLYSVFDASHPLKIDQFTIHDFDAKDRPLTIPEIYIYSSNIGTAKMAQSLGPDTIENFYRTLGFMQQVPIQVPERAMPLYPSPWRLVNTLTAAFGHGIAVSPLHVVRAASAIVNGGILLKPTLVMPDDPNAAPEGTRVISADTSAKMRRMLELVVAGGTGSEAWVKGYDVGGKTGTADKNKNGKYENHANISSFLGVFPIWHPRYVVLALLDDPQGTKATYGFSTGGFTAAPVVGDVIARMGPLYGIQPRMDITRKRIEKEMKPYLKEYKEGQAIAALSTDN